jgi:hypothetical protein
VDTAAPRANVDTVVKARPDTETKVKVAISLGTEAKVKDRAKVRQVSSALGAFCPR